MPRNGTLRLGFLLTLLLCASILPARSGWKVVESQATVGVTTSEARGVAYLGSKPNTLYTTIEKAVEVANDNVRKPGASGETVYVLAGISGIKDNKPNPIVISKNLTLNSGVTLCLPYDTTDREKPKSVWREEVKSGFADKDANSEKNNLKTEVLLEENVTLTISEGAKFVVGGVLGGGGAGAPQGATVGSYAQLTLGGSVTTDENDQVTGGIGAKIVNHGTIECYGYIKPESEAVNDYTSLTMSPSADMTVPLVFYDFRGGDAMTVLYYGSATNALLNNVRGIFPIEVFDFPNVSVPSTLSFGADLNVLGSLYIGTTQTFLNTDPILLVGSESGNVKPIFGMKDGGTFEFDYVPASVSETSGRTYTVNDFGTDKKAKTKIDIVGGAKMSDIVMPNFIDFEKFLGEGGGIMNELTGVRDVSTAGLKLPFSYKWDVTLDGGNYEFDIQAKFLPGSKVTVGENATATMKWDTLFYEGGASHFAQAGLQPYPKNLEGAKLINNGDLVLEGRFGAYIETEVEGSTVTFTGSRDAATERGFSGTPSLTAGANWVDEINRASTGDIVSGTSVSPATSFPSGSAKFVSVKTDSGFGYKASLVPASDMKINFKTNRGSRWNPQEISPLVEVERTGATDGVTISYSKKTDSVTLTDLFIGDVLVFTNLGNYEGFIGVGKKTTTILEQTYISEPIYVAVVENMTSLDVTFD